MQSKLSSRTQLLPHSLGFEAIGTRWRIDTSSTLSGAVLVQIFTIIGAFDKKWSRFRADSVVTKRSQAPGKISLDTDEYEMFTLYRRLYDASTGALTPLVGQTLADMGYDSHYSLRPDVTIRSPAAWDDTLELTASSLRLKKNALLDIGAAGKGLLVDRVSHILAQHLRAFTVDAGGDIYVRGHSEQIGLENYSDNSQAIGTVILQDRALCGSATNRRAWGAHHHIIDAHEVASVTRVAATWALSDSAMHADMASTALFFIDPSVLTQILTAPYVVVHPNGAVRYAKEKEIEIYA